MIIILSLSPQSENVLLFHQAQLKLISVKEFMGAQSDDILKADLKFQETEIFEETVIIYFANEYGPFFARGWWNNEKSCKMQTAEPLMRPNCSRASFFLYYKKKKLWSVRVPHCNSLLNSRYGRS